MTVAQLIEKLREFQPEMKVYVWNDAEDQAEVDTVQVRAAEYLWPRRDKTFFPDGVVVLE